MGSWLLIARKHGSTGNGRNEFYWLHEEKRGREEEHQKLVDRVVSSADGGSFICHGSLVASAASTRGVEMAAEVSGGTPPMGENGGARPHCCWISLKLAGALAFHSFWLDEFRFCQKDSACAFCGYFEHQRGSI